VTFVTKIDLLLPSSLTVQTAKIENRQRFLLFVLLRIPLAKPSFTPEQYARLKAEAQSPYRGLRRFVYVGFGASGLIGAFIFTLQLLAGQDALRLLPNLALQLGLVALMVYLYRWDSG